MEKAQGRGGSRRCCLWVGFRFLSSLSSLPPLSLLASVGAFVVGWGCVVEAVEEGLRSVFVGSVVGSLFFRGWRCWSVGVLAEVVVGDGVMVEELVVEEEVKKISGCWRAGGVGLLWWFLFFSEGGGEEK